MVSVCAAWSRHCLRWPLWKGDCAALAALAASPGQHSQQNEGGNFHPRPPQDLSYFDRADPRN
jgi:hypothetical protein